MTTSIEGAVVTTFTFDSNENLQNTQLGTARISMVYDKENRTVNHLSGAVRTTYTSAGDGLKRSERSGATITTLIWDGSNFLQTRG